MRLRRAQVAAVDELGCDLREQRKGEHVLLALGEVLVLLAVLGKLGLQKVGGAAGDDVLGLDARLGADLFVDGSGQLAVFAAQHGLGLLGDHLVALAGDDVQHGLRADDLAGRRDQRGIAEVLAHARNLSEHVVVLVLLARLLELGDEVREHTAGDLIEERVRVDIQHLRVERAARLELIRDLAEVDGSLAHLVQVEARVARRALERGDEGLRCGLGRAVGERGERGVDNVDARHRGHQVDHVARAAGVVRVQVDGDADGLLEALDKGVGIHRQQQVRHVLDAESVRAHLLELLSELHEIILIVDGGDGVGESGLDLTAVFLRGLDGLL